MNWNWRMTLGTVCGTSLAAASRSRRDRKIGVSADWGEFGLPVGSSEEYRKMRIPVEFSGIRVGMLRGLRWMFT